MNNDNNTILGFDVNLICDFFLNTERQGPGSPEVTLKALSFIDNLTDKSLIADLGWHNMRRGRLQASTFSRDSLNVSTRMPRN